MNRPVSIRATDLKDIPSICQHRYPDPEQAVFIEAYARWLVGAMNRGLYQGWVAEVQERVVAGAGLMLLEWGPGHLSESAFRGRVVNVFTEPSFRRRGLARALVQQCLEMARSRGIAQVGLSTSEMARGLYEELGFLPATSEMILQLKCGSHHYGIRALP